MPIQCVELGLAIGAFFIIGCQFVLTNSGPTSAPAINQVLLAINLEQHQHQPAQYMCVFPHTDQYSTPHGSIWGGFCDARVRRNKLKEISAKEISVRGAQKNVLFADGTGNSSASAAKTNVWRAYKALDVSRGSNQVAFYDGGVGTSSFSPLKLFGLVFGLGLANNVRQIYKFVCTSYIHDDDDEKNGPKFMAWVFRAVLSPCGLLLG